MRGRGGVWCRGVAVDPTLPEPFAPTGPKLSRFPIRPAAPIRPHLFPDEARFALRLAILAGATECVAWAWLASAEPPRRWLLALAAVRFLKPLWAGIGARAPRPAVALALLLVAFLGAARNLLTPLAGGLLAQLSLAAIGLPALADLGASCIADSVTVERRAAAYAWLDLAQAVGAALGVALGPWAAMASIAILPLASLSLPALRDRSTPRSAWAPGSYLLVLRAPLTRQLALLSFLGGAFAMAGPSRASTWLTPLLTLGGMSIAARIEGRMPNAIWLPRIAALAAAAGWLLPPLRTVALGAMLVAIPAAVARGAGEMERPLASSLSWSALFAGAALGAMLGS